MLWVILSLASAFSLSTADALTKRALGRWDEYSVTFMRFLYALPVLIPVLFLTGRPALDREFYTAFAVAVPLEVLATVLYIKALKLSPLSLSMPFLALTPVYMMGFSYFILGERVSAQGIAGILLVASGGYVLNLSRAREGLLGPVKAIFREKGSVLILFVSAIYGFTASLGKVAILHSSPAFFASTYYLVLAAAFLPFGVYGMRKERRVPSFWAMAAIGAASAAMVLTHMYAMGMAYAAYMISVKRTSLLINVAYAKAMFKEENTRERLAGAVLMLSGFFIIVAAG